MGIISRGPKAAGGKDFTTGTILAAEVNTDFNTVYELTEGNIDEDNIDPAANIPNSSLAPIGTTFTLSHADDDATWFATRYPGTTAVPVKPLSLAFELENIRWRMHGNKAQINVQYMDSDNNLVDAGWVEPGSVGRNLLPNPGFEAQTGVADSAPDGWALVGTPATVDILVPSDEEAGLEKRSLRIEADDASEGISTVVGGLKSSTKYIIGIAYILNVGEMNLITAGGLPANTDYQDISFNDSTAAGAFESWQGIFSTNATADDVTVTIQSTAAADDFEVFYVWMYELSDLTPVEIPHIPMQKVDWAGSGNDTQTNAGAGAWETKTGLSLEQYVPHVGYKFTYEVMLSFVSGGSGQATSIPSYAFRIQEEIDGGGADTVEGPFAYNGILAGASSVSPGLVTLKHVIENPTPGSIYAFTVDAYIEGTGSTYPDTLIFNPKVGAAELLTKSSARLTIERL